MGPLHAIRLVHTAIWAFFVACILAIPILTSLSRFGLASVFAAVVALEVAVLLMNRLTCPLTSVAGRYTTDRRANFDIYLPEWLAHHNKIIFGTLYLISVLFLIVRWAAAQ